MKRPVRQALAALVLLAALSAAGGGRADPTSGRIDPPPAALTYVDGFAPSQWVFGELLWRGREPCTGARCEAVYNAHPYWLLVSTADNCCGDPGHSVMVQVDIAGCAARSYYLFFDKDVEDLSDAARLDLIGRHLADMLTVMQKACGAPPAPTVPTEALDRLFAAPAPLARTAR